MKFLKANSYDIVRLYIYQIAIAIFSMFMYFAVSALSLEEDSKLLASVAVSVFSTVFYCFILYAAAWDMGSRDKIRIDGGRLEHSKWKGMLLSLSANSLNALLAAFALLFIGLNMALHADAFRTLYVIFEFILVFTTAMYNGLVQGVFSGIRVSNEELYLLLQPIGLIVASLLSVATTHVGYGMGVKDRRIMQLFQKTPKE